MIQDIAAALAYILATFQISDKVFGLPVGALLATSGAVAIVVGLALQSALGDAFSGLVLNLTRPYRIGDWIAVDATLARAAREHSEILGDPEPQVAIRSLTVEFVDYEVRFFIARQANEAQVSTQYFDMAFQHLDSLGVSRSPQTLVCLGLTQACATSNQ